MNHNRLYCTSVMKSRRKVFLLAVMLLTSGMASAQVVVKGNVYGGGEQGVVTENTTVTMNGGTVGEVTYGRKQGTPSTAPFDTIIHTNEAGRVFGGGKGDDTDPNSGRVNGNTTVTINGGHVQFNVYGGGEMASVGTHTEVNGDFVPATNNGTATVNINGGVVGPMPRVGTSNDSVFNIPCSVFGLDGYIIGGGRGKGNHETNDYKDFANVNNTIVTVDMDEWDPDNNKYNRIWGSVFGGGEDGHVLGNTHVVYEDGLCGPDGTVDYGGNIFGGGRNFYDHFITCGRVRGNTEVEMTGGHILGSLFGGGRSGSTGVDRNGNMIHDANYGKATLTMSGGEVGNPDIIKASTRTCGDVFGSGKGHKSSIDLGKVRTADVTITGTARVYGSVHGGGELACVGDFQLDQSGNGVSLVDGGSTLVTVNGGIIGMYNMKMYDPAHPNESPDDFGHVFGGGKGLVADATLSGNQLVPYLGNTGSTKVIIGQKTVNEITTKAFVLGSVFGGAENGHVVGNTLVEIEAGQIGFGEGQTTPYDEAAFIDPFTIDVTASLAPCPHWAYGDENHLDYSTYDMYYGTNGYTPANSAKVGLDGKTFYGNVFGGGSGRTPYAPGQWNQTAGSVTGNTVIQITGGHILANVYGGNTMTTVSGTATISMSAGTIGVPRLADDIIAYPIIGHVFGGGKGDPRSTFDAFTNVASTNIDVSGGIIYGSVFGGSAEGHVTENSVINVHDGAKIGTFGTTAWDGNVFGGGMGSGVYTIVENNPGPDDNDTIFSINRSCGRIGGNTTVTMDGGHLLGSIFGGGRLGLTGINQSGEFNGASNGKATITVSAGTIGTSDYAKLLQSDASVGDIFGAGKGDVDNYCDIWAGRVTNAEVKVTGSPRIYGGVWGGGEMASVGYWNDNGVFAENTGSTKVTIGESGSNPIIGTTEEFDLSNANISRWTILDTINGEVKILHSCTGNVYGGCQGDVDVEAPSWVSMGRSREAKVFINGGEIKGSVFGGAEHGTVIGDTYVNVTAGTIGQASLVSDSLQYNTTTHQWEAYNEPVPAHYAFGSIFGGGYGSDELTAHTNDSLQLASQLAGRTYGNTYVTMTGGHVLEGVFGGGDLASVGHVKSNGTMVNGHCTVSISGSAIVGQDHIDYENGDVFGSGRGKTNDPDEDFAPYCNANSTAVTINLNESGTTGHVYGSVYGGGPDSHVLGNTSVTLTAGLVGSTGSLGWDGHLFGGGKGQPGVYTPGRVAGNTYVAMEGGNALGNVYGGGRVALTGVDEDGDVTSFVDNSGNYDLEHHGLAVVEVSGGTIGIGDTEPGVHTQALAMLTSDYSIGDIFGGGRGDTEEYDDVNAGRVANTNITVSGNPTIYCSVFGGGEIAGVGYWNNSGTFVKNTGETKVTVKDTPTIGTEYEFSEAYALLGDDATPWTVYDTTNRHRKLFHTCSGNVFGASQGDIDTECPHWISMGRSRTSEVNISGGTIMSSVFGGAEQGTVIEDTKVSISGGTIGKAGLVAYNLNRNAQGEWEIDPDHSITYSFGNVFGGGYGVDTLDLHVNDSCLAGNIVNAPRIAGRVYGNTEVEISDGTIRGNVFGGGNMASVGYVKADGSLVKGNAKVTISGNANIGDGLDGTGLNAYVFGGGKGIGNNPDARYFPFCNVNSTEVFIDLASTGHIWGSVYGGGSDSHVLGNTSVVLEKTNVGIIGTLANSSISDWGGNIFGGGRNFLKRTYSPGRVAGNTYVEMNNGIVYGSIFGGGRHAVTGVGVDGMTMGEGDDHGNTTVKVKGGTVGCAEIMRTFTARTIGDVYGGGKGTMEGITFGTHPSVSALLIALTKNTTVEISQANNAIPTKILGTVFGGGEVASVGNFVWGNVNGTIGDIHLASDGNTSVTVSGGQIGVERMEMDYTLGDDPDDFSLKFNTNLGHVFGGCEGVVQDPGTELVNPAGEGHNYGHNNVPLLDLMATVGNTLVTIEGSAW